MKILTSIEQINNQPPCCCALGNFDGIHLGHRALIEKAADFGREKGLAPSVFTFSNHPKEVLTGVRGVKNIMTSEEKEEMLEDLGVEFLFNLPFTEEIMNMSPEDFVRGMLKEKFNAKAVVTGFNFRFGKNAGGDVSDLRTIGESLGIEVITVPPFMVGDDVVSSSLIRTLISSGRVDRCREYMGRNYAISGEVVVGNRLGRKLGFPTSNLVIDDSMVTPPNGVYVTYCDYNGEKFRSVTNVGVRPTVGEFGKNVETHIFDFDRELYGKKIKVEFLMKMRDEVKFESVEDLSEQIVRDCREALKFHEKNTL